MVVTQQLSIAFSDGTLCSDFITEENLVHCFHVIREGRAPTPVMEAEKEKVGIGSFTVRMVSSLAKKSLTKNSVVISYVVMMYPGTKEETLQTSEHTHQSGKR